MLVQKILFALQHIKESTSSIPLQFDSRKRFITYHKKCHLLTLFLHKEDLFTKLFFSSTIIQWNKLNINLRNSRNLFIFKKTHTAISSYDDPRILCITLINRKGWNLWQDFVWSWVIYVSINLNHSHKKRKDSLEIRVEPTVFPL